MSRKPSQLTTLNSQLLLAAWLILLSIGLPWRASAAAPASTPASRPATQPAQDPAFGLLAEQGITPDADGIGRYLRQVHADATDNDRIASLIRQLGSDSFTEREEATKKLLALPLVPEVALRKAAQSEDAEVRGRAEHILAEAGGRTNDRILSAAMATVTGRRIRGLAGPILQVLPLYPQPWLQGQFRSALRATSTPDDAKILRAAMKDPLADTRRAATLALAGALGEQAREDLAAAQRDAAAVVRLAAARELANLGDRRCLDALAALLSADEVAVRSESHAVLRAATGKDFRFVAYEDANTRAAGAEAWKQWILAEGAAAPLQFPLKVKPPWVPQGRTLLCSHAQEALIEVDANNVQTFRAEGLSMPWGCQALPNGNRLVVSHSQARIVELDRDGKEVWVKDDLPGGPMSVQRLDSGNTLVALSSANKVVEYAPSGKVAWEADLKEECTSAQRLDNGNTLVAMRKAGRVVEVNPAGKVVWKLENLQDPQAVQRLENGNTLVAETVAGKVSEYDAAGKAVWSKDGFQNPLDCQRLPDGHTIVVDRVAVHELAPDGKEVGTLDRQGLSRAWRY